MLRAGTLMRQSRLPAVAVLAMALAMPATARSITLHVSNTGTDGPTCGGATPCRSIGTAVANAVAGDTIMVGPGLYSADLDRDGSRSEPGEEPVLLVIDKAVTILSSFGASSTVIEGAGINIATSNVTFGKLNAGFTISTVNNPLIVSGATPSLANVRVAGNVIVEDDPQGAAAVIWFQAGGRFENNRVVSQRGCNQGVSLLNVPASTVVTHNAVQGCATGFFTQDATGARLVSNTAVGNGFATPDGIGFDLHGNVAEVSSNVAIGNATGARVTTAIPIFQKNAFAGSVSGCGVTNVSGTTLNAANNWWGSPAGPSDAFDVACNLSGSTTITSPFLTTDPSQQQAALR